MSFSFWPRDVDLQWTRDCDALHHARRLRSGRHVRAPYHAGALHFPADAFPVRQL